MPYSNKTPAKQYHPPNKSSDTLRGPWGPQQTRAPKKTNTYSILDKNWQKTRAGWMERSRGFPYLVNIHNNHHQDEITYKLTPDEKNGIFVFEGTTISFLEDEINFIPAHQDKMSLFDKTMPNISFFPKDFITLLLPKLRTIYIDRLRDLYNPFDNTFGTKDISETELRFFSQVTMHCRTKIKTKDENYFQQDLETNTIQSIAVGSEIPDKAGVGFCFELTGHGLYEKLRNKTSRLLLQTVTTKIYHSLEMIALQLDLFYYNSNQPNDLHHTPMQKKIF